MTIWELFFLSAVPLTEQRATIPLGIISYNYDPVLITIICFIGCLLPVPFILLFFNKFYEWMAKIKYLNFVKRIIDKKVARNTKKFEKLKEVALISFVGIPLPVTGIWTGTIMAVVLGLDYKKSIISIVIGNAISAIILLLLSLFVPYIFNI